MRKLLFLLLLLPLAAVAQTLQAPAGKLIYHPRDLWDNDFTDPNAQWSYARMAATDNVVIFWEPGFGPDPATAPPLDGHPMTVDIPNLLRRIEEFYVYYRDTLKFVLAGSKSERYRMMVMLNYSLEGTAYGGTYDNEIGALWIAPNRVQDRKLNCIAHELGHSFQIQVAADHAGEAWGGGGIYEMTSQWMLWQVNPQWTTDENYHWQAFRHSFHLAFGAGENIYRSPYVLEYWSMRHGLEELGRLFRAGRAGEQPADTYMRIHQMSIEQMNAEMVDCYSRLQTFDFPRLGDTHRHMAGELASQPGDDMGRWGFNVIHQPAAKSVTAALDSVNRVPDGCHVEYQFVAVDTLGRPTYYGRQRAPYRQRIHPKKGTREVLLVAVACPD